MILYNYDLDATCYMIRLAAACLGHKPALHNIDMFPGKEHLSAAMLAINPAGSLPVLVDGALTLTQPLGILMHLGQGHALMGGVQMYDWLGFALGPLMVALDARAASMLNAPGDVGALRARARACLRVMEDHMTLQVIHGRGFFAGEASLADIALFPAFALSRDCNIDHDEFPALRLWARRVRGLPAFITMPGIPDYH